VDRVNLRRRTKCQPHQSGIEGREDCLRVKSTMSVCRRWYARLMWVTHCLNNFSFYMVRQKCIPLRVSLQFSQQSLGISRWNFTNVFSHPIYVHVHISISLAFGVFKLWALQWCHLTILRASKCPGNYTANYAVQATCKVIKQHNTAVTVISKVSAFSYKTGIQSFYKLFYSYVYRILS